MVVSIYDIVSNSKIIDIRDAISFNEKHYPDSINVPRMKLLNDPSLYIKKNETIYLICDIGTSSLSTAKVLNKLGYKCFSIKDGIEGLK